MNPTLPRLKTIFGIVIGVLMLVIGGGAMYIEQEPALSPRALGSDLIAVFLRLRYASIVDAAPAATTTARTIPVLTYHRIVSDFSDIANVPRSRFEDQMVTLKKAGWQAVSLQAFEGYMRGENTLPDRSFLLTFDDGAKDSYYPVDPILRALGYYAVNFIIVAASEIPRTVYYLTEKEIKNMIATGRWSIGSHSFDGHRPYPVGNGDTGIFFADRLWRDDAQRLETEKEFRARVTDDLTKARESLQTAYKTPINSFAFPLGNETGINGANNYPPGASVTEDIARGLYTFGYVQNNRQQFSANLPRTASSSDPFLVHRIHVDYDWDGERVLAIMENGRPKSLPYEDDFSVNNGWISAWGEQEIGRNNFVIAATEDAGSAESFLDGTQLWDNYSFETAVNWDSGHLILLADLTRSDSYDACVFSPGEVKIQRTMSGTTTNLTSKKVPRVQYGENVNAGIRVHGATIECTWNFASMIEDYSRSARGGIGIQTWSPEPRSAGVRVISIIVRPLGT